MHTLTELFDIDIQKVGQKIEGIPKRKQVQEV